jgi:hypothetical protein
MVLAGPERRIGAQVIAVPSQHSIALKNHLRLGTRLRQGFAGQAASPSIRDFPSIPPASLEGEPVVSRVFQRNPM